MLYLVTELDENDTPICADTKLSVIAKTLGISERNLWSLISNHKSDSKVGIISKKHRFKIKVIEEGEIEGKWMRK